MKKTLIMVDLQNDFCKGGSLAVPEGDQVITLANQLQTKFDLVIATKDFHPKDHVSFASRHPGHRLGEKVEVNGLSQVLWPDHCVQGTEGAEFHPQLDTQRITKIVFKGVDESIDSYSAFFDNAHLRSTGLLDYLKEQDISEVYLLGLATDYCVKYSAFDAIHVGLHVFVIEDACRGVELHPGDIQKAIQDMQSHGVKMVSSATILKPA